MAKITTTGIKNDEAARDPSVIPAETEFQADLIIDCPVCLYWSERLETSRAYTLSHSEAIGEEKRLLVIIRQHQAEGACLRRLPYLMELLTEPENTQTN